ncbi:translational GTPase TypA [Haematospirillum jordaniae]|uniref:Large ribosomal subunit assembly factor BipA n=1 Tax=Haematospirillum jordaniae TaxID=1549855 RepID=A0A143DE86_9PROT|nr:translational GTPase TypA [Haematospirillum jordaniae]AMW34583.1 GTP-binding protein TypA [Haematospirillum jordaniae]NKD46196.1 translational GTPase TypA [Haematospirillum jordaniae]NKD58110.1 translational GTPase TypA [Haematospirillum jordaniae]NKD60223.1 translational GTPase TypA [Haematospirillum jordaniae]NKD68147.1 translational GTPase TypA [Haematospirillum jordaniae]
MDLRNIAIIAHVDHGKTTLVDAMLKQSGTFRDNQKVAERAMDSNDLERERGITILAKCTSVDWQGHRINIVDTPGHADFGGEVERILSMVDGVVLLCDSAEGPLPQTKFVLSKALKLGLRPIVLINKVDRQDARPDEVHDEIFDLFANLDASDAQLDFPTLFAVGRDGWAVADLEKDERKDLTPLFDLILRHVPAPERNLEAPFSMLATTLEADPYLGRILTGRIATGRAKLNMAIKAISRDGSLIEQGRASKLLAFRGLQRVPVEEAEAGDIIALAGLAKANVADTLCAPEIDTPLTAQPIDPPTLAMTFTVNDSPLAGTEGDKLTSRVIKARLEREAEGNVAIRITESADKDSFEVAGRGELQLGVLIETMRREGFELSISRPRVLFREENGQRMEPIEEVVVDVDEEFSGTVVEKMSLRKAEMTDMRPSGGGKLRITFLAPSRGLIGYHSEFLTDTRGTGIMNRLYHSYAPYKGPIEGRRTGVLISNGKGEAVAYALFNLLDRGPQFVVHNDKVYEGMIVGEHTRSNDLEVNVLKGKQLTNIRAAGKDEAVRLPPPKKMTLEEALSYIQDDELVEVTPQSIRLRKRFLDPNERKRAAKAGTFA